jgi:hypothetical protein
MAVRIQRKRVKGWRMPPGAVNVTRGTEWGNPFKVGDVLDLGPSLGVLTITRTLAVELYAEWVTQRGWGAQIRRELAGKDLVCWCPTWARCHADVLLELANS